MCLLLIFHRMVSLGWSVLTAILIVSAVAHDDSSLEVLSHVNDHGNFMNEASFFFFNEVEANAKSAGISQYNGFSY